MPGTTGEEAMVLEEGHAPKFEEPQLISRKQLNALIRDYNNFLDFNDKIAHGMKIAAGFSLIDFILSVSYYCLDTEKTWLIMFIAMGVVGGIASSTGLCVSSRQPHNWLFSPLLPSDYPTKKSEALKIINSYSISINDEPSAFEIRNALQRVKNIIIATEGTPSKRKEAISNSLVNTLFHSLNQKTRENLSGTIFEYADLSETTIHPLHSINTST